MILPISSPYQTSGFSVALAGILFCLLLCEIGWPAGGKRCTGLGIIFANTKLRYKVKTKVYDYSPDIPVGSADLK